MEDAHIWPEMIGKKSEQGIGRPERADRSSIDMERSPDRLLAVHRSYWNHLYVLGTGVEYPGKVLYFLYKPSVFL